MVAEGTQSWNVAGKARLSNLLNCDLKFCRKDNVIYAAERVFSAIVNVLAGNLAVGPWSGDSLFAWGEFAKEEEVAACSVCRAQLCKWIWKCHQLLVSVSVIY
eukprot:1155445-Pelagomonas_calceolata.AAC.2